MDDRPPAPRSPEEWVRQLGFDPSYLTPQERMELVELNRTLAAAPAPSQAATS